MEHGAHFLMFIFTKSSNFTIFLKKIFLIEIKWYVKSKSLMQHQMKRIVYQFLLQIMKSFVVMKIAKKNITKRDFDKDSKENVSWLKTHEMKVVITHAFSLFLKYPDVDHFYELNYAKLKRKPLTITSLPWNQVHYVVLYPDGRKLTAAKKKDFLNISSLLPIEGQEYIKKITQSDEEDIEEDIDGFSASDYAILNDNEY